MIDLFSKKSYYYDLPSELIAQTPIEPRDNSRLLVFDKNSKTTEHKIFKDIVDYFSSGDVLVLNNTKVIPARLFGNKSDTGAKIEVFLLKRKEDKNYEVLLKPYKKVKIGSKILFNDKISAVCLEKYDEGIALVQFEYEGVFEERISEVGTMPLPPYIHKKLVDQNRYQTIYAKENGSSAAPTAGLHFTNELLDKLKQKGVIIVDILLHVGLGTFRPVKVDNILKHDMHSEYYEVGSKAAKIINEAKRCGKKIFAVGTTSVRVLESSCDENGNVLSQKGNTNIFIYPSYKFKVVDSIITNFHLPESTLIMLVSAFIGYENTMMIYNEAVKLKYRFFSFGDAMLLK